jgi:hypothetical protein
VDTPVAILWRKLGENNPRYPSPERGMISFYPQTQRSKRKAKMENILQKFTII